MTVRAIEHENSPKWLMAFKPIEPAIIVNIQWHVNDALIFERYLSVLFW